MTFPESNHTQKIAGELGLERLPIADQLSQEPSLDEQAIAALFDRDVRTSSVFYKSPKRMSICFCCRTFKCHRQPCPCSKYVF